MFIKEERPLQFFSILAGVFALTSVLLAWPVLTTYLETGLVPRFPTAILATGLMLIGALSFTAGLILDTVTRGRREAKRMRYLSIHPYADGMSTPPGSRPSPSRSRRRGSSTAATRSPAARRGEGTPSTAGTLRCRRSAY